MTFREHAEAARWHTLAAIDCAPDEPGLHPGATAHLKAARAQHDAAVRLLASHDSGARAARP